MNKICKTMKLVYFGQEKLSYQCGFQLQALLFQKGEDQNVKVQRNPKRSGKHKP